MGERGAGMITFTCDLCGKSEEPNQVPVHRTLLECPKCLYEFMASIGPVAEQMIRLPIGWKSHNMGNDWHVVVCENPLCQQKYERQAHYSSQVMGGKL
jgi:hypothetical protein